MLSMSGHELIVDILLSDQYNSELRTGQPARLWSLDSTDIVEFDLKVLHDGRG